MPEPRDESADNLSLLQKQLILAQVQILELEDVRDELGSEIAGKTKLLTELQQLTDRALREVQEASSAETAARQELNLLRDESTRLRLGIETLEREARLNTQSFRAAEAQLGETKTVIAAQIARIETLDAELRTLKASRSWRWTAPLRSLERLFR